ncbi:MAG: RsmE family RNA methyltransferase, partial [Tepidisphaeraceae bacterium]
ARNVLRLRIDDEVQAFDDAGATGVGRVIEVDPVIVLEILSVRAAETAPALTIASAVPKGDRADWLAEKLSEVGVDRWVPLRTARSVVHPEGEKTKRWDRIAIEAAKQSRRTGVLRIERLTPLATLISQPDLAPAYVLTTRPGAQPLTQALDRTARATLLIGPEGGWDDAEQAQMIERGLTPVTLGPTILRIETAALLAAGIVRLLQQTTNE